MGKHSDPDQHWFWLSLVAGLAKPLLVAGLLAAVAIGAWRWTQNGPPTPSPAAAGDVAGDADAAVDPAAGFDPAAPAEEATEDQDEAEAAGEEAGGDEAPVRATVQVLDASGVAGALEAAVGALESLGYEVVTTGQAVRGYTRTTLLWTEGFEREALALRAADHRFGVVQPNTRLDPTINLHVVVGADWPGG